MNEQTTMFDFMYDTFKIDKPIRLIENFAGIGAQAKALKNLGLKFEHWRIVEWAYPSILSYNEIHHNELENYGKNFVDEGCTKDELAQKLFDYGISANYNEPMKLEQIKRLQFDKLKQIYNAIRSTKNLVNIQNVHGEDLEIKNTDQYIYIYIHTHFHAKI